MADRPNKVLEHQQMVKQMLLKQQEQNRIAEEADRKRREVQRAEEERLDKARRAEEMRVFLLTPAGQAWKIQEERKRILAEARENFRLLCEAHVRKREELRAKKFEIGTIITAYRDITPIPHRISERLHYKICVAPFDPDDTEDFSQEPSWVLIDCPEMMRHYKGVVAFCDKPMKEGQQAKIIRLSEKSCMIQPIALIPKAKK